MKLSIPLLLCFLLFLLPELKLYSQAEKDSTSIIYEIVKQNDASFIGTIISQDAREVLIKTEDVGLVYIPKHEIREISEREEGEEIVSGGLFATRYFLTTNGFNIDKGDNYVQWNIFGPDFQFGVADNFTLGVMTSWVGMPIVGTAKYSSQLSESLYGGVGFLGGTGSWAFPEYGLVLPFGFLSSGNRTNNLNFTAGYGVVFSEKYETTHTLVPSTYPEYETNSVVSDSRSYNDSEGRVLFSVAGMFRINDKFSFVFDSFFMLKGKDITSQEVVYDYNQTTGRTTHSIRTVTQESNPLTVIVPGIRFQSSTSSSLQFGFTGIHFDGEFLPVPIPMIQWFKRI